MCLAVANSYYPSHQRVDEGTKLQGLKPVHYSAAGLDVIIAVALFTLGMLGMHAGFLPAGVSVAFMVGGFGYGAAILALLGVIYSNLQTSQAILDAVETIDSKNERALTRIYEDVAEINTGITTNSSGIGENKASLQQLNTRVTALMTVFEDIRTQLSESAAPPRSEEVDEASRT